jgi:hypothetical protein
MFQLLIKSKHVQLCFLVLELQAIQVMVEDKILQHPKLFVERAVRNKEVLMDLMKSQ